jgi:hypothetical protein
MFGGYLHSFSVSATIRKRVDISAYLAFVLIDCDVSLLNSWRRSAPSSICTHYITESIGLASDFPARPKDGDIGDESK